MDETQLSGLLAVILSRAAERIMLIAAGALTVWLGYRLFAIIPSSDRAEGKIKLPGGVSIFLTRIGPGAFFALFGCAIIGYSVTRPVAFSSAWAPGSGATTEAHTGSMQYSGVGRDLAGVPGPARSNRIAPATSGADHEQLVRRLNVFFTEARPHLSAPALLESEATLRAAKLALMTAGWNEAWGDQAAFTGWVTGGATSAPPLDRAGVAVMIFNTGIR